MGLLSCPARRKRPEIEAKARRRESQWNTGPGLTIALAQGRTRAL